MDQPGVLWMGRAFQGRGRLLRLPAVCEGCKVKLLAAAVMGGDLGVPVAGGLKNHTGWVLRMRQQGQAGWVRGVSSLWCCCWGSM